MALPAGVALVDSGPSWPIQPSCVPELASCVPAQTGGALGRLLGNYPQLRAVFTVLSIALSIAPWLVAAAAGSGCVGTDSSAGAGSASVDAKAQPSGKISYSVQDGTTIIQWPEDEWPFHCVRLVQTVAGKAKPVEVPLCNKQEGRNKIVIGTTAGAKGVDFSWQALADLDLGSATWTLEGGSKNWGVTPNVIGSGTVQLGPHFGGPCQTASTVTTGLEEWHFTAPATIKVSVKLGEAARSGVEVSKPDIWVDSVASGGSAAKGGTLTFSYTFAKPGMYTVEVNNTAGGAILNCAVYVAADLPLIAVEVTSGAGLVAPPSETQLATYRQKLLDLTNAERNKVGLAALQLDETLNKIAQHHSDDMGQKGYFAHNSPDGEGPGDRAKKFGWTKGIGENIASNLSIEGAHNGLFWSAAHRKNMLGAYKVAGFGVAKAAGESKNMLVTENFGD
ncbi:MAG: CAP domain-containing protein [Myxococcales bacterium]|nr:CAP domain-containing protein [Myxococcales bacterium]